MFHPDYKYAEYPRTFGEYCRFFLSSLDRFLISGLIFSFPACKVLNRVLLHSTCFALFSAQEFLMIFENFEVIILHNSLAIWCAN